MSKRSQNYNAARYIRAIDRQGSISAAAEELGISQPAMSLFLKKVEDRLGAAVFDRACSPLTLTPAGIAYLEYEDSVAQLRAGLTRKISDLNDLQSGDLVVGGTASFNTTLLPQAIAEFTARYPGVNVSVLDDTLPNLARKAVEGSIDAFIASSLQDNGMFDCVELCQERFFLCVPRDWPVCKLLPSVGEGEFALIGREDFKLLDGHVFIAMHDDQQIGKKLEELLEEYDITPKQTIHVNQALTSLAFTRAGIGISLVTEGALRCCNPSDMPALFLPDAQSYTRTLFLAKPNNRTTPRAVEELTSILLNQSF